MIFRANGKYLLSRASQHKLAGATAARKTVAGYRRSAWEVDPGLCTRVVWLVPPGEGITFAWD